MKVIEAGGERFELIETPTILNGTQVVEIKLVHIATRRVKSGTSSGSPETLIKSLIEDLHSDLDDVAAGHLPSQAGRFDP